MNFAVKTCRSGVCTELSGQGDIGPWKWAVPAKLVRRAMGLQPSPISRAMSSPAVLSVAMPVTTSSDLLYRLSSTCMHEVMLLPMSRHGKALEHESSPTLSTIMA